MALRAVKTEEEIAGIPQDQPILIELPGGVIDDEPNEPKDKTPKPEIDPAAKTLQDQYETLQRESAERERVANERATKAEREADAERKRRSSLEGDVISGGLSAAQSERDSAKQALQAAGEAGDWKSIADAQSRIGRAEAKILSFESGAAEIAERTETEKTQPRQEQVLQKPLDPMSAIDGNPNLLPAEKAWLKAHPDAVIDGRRNNELSVGYERAIKKGLVRGSPDYLAFLEDFMGYAKSNDEDRSISVQAPPSRNERGNDGRVTGGRITLTPEERQAAKDMGVSEIDYAKQKVVFEQKRREDPEKYSSRG